MINKWIVIVLSLAACIGSCDRSRDDGDRDSTAVLPRGTVSATGSRPPVDLTKGELDTIVRQIMLDDSLSIHEICSAADTLPASGVYMESMSLSDAAFMQRQNRLFKGWTLPKTGLLWYASASSEFRAVTVIDTCSRAGYHNYLSLVSPDRNRVILQHLKCCGMLSGSGVKVL